MSVMSTLKAKLDEALAMAADAKRRLDSTLDLDAGLRAASEKSGAEAVAANLEAKLAEAQAEAELERLADARTARLAQIEQEQAKAIKAGAALQKALPDQLLAAVSDLRAAVAACKSAGFVVGIEMPREAFIEQQIAEIRSKGRNLAADAKALSPDFIDMERALIALGEASQSFSWASGRSAPSMPHMRHSAYRHAVEADSDQSAFVRENWHAPDEDARDRVMSLLVEGNAL